MSESKETDEKPARARKPLSLKRTVDAGHVQQKFSHGRSKSVVVEKKRKRTVAAPEREGSGRATGKRGAAAAKQSAQAQSPGGLSQEEVAKRAAALAAAQRASKEAEREAAEEAKRKAKLEAEELERKKAAEAAERKKAEEKAAKAEAAKKKAEQVEAHRAANGAAMPAAEPVAEEATAEAAEQADLTQPETARSSPATGRQGEPVIKQPVGMIAPVIVTRGDRPDPKKPAEPQKKAEE